MVVVYIGRFVEANDQLKLNSVTFFSTSSLH
jgi:hypothetical protein